METQSSGPELILALPVGLSQAATPSPAGGHLTLILEASFSRDNEYPDH